MATSTLDRNEIKRQLTTLVNRIFHPAFWLVSLLPPTLIIAVLTYTIRTRLSLGYWPQPYRPDPWETPYHIHYDLTFLCLRLTLWAAIVWPIMYFLARHMKMPVRRSAIIFFLASWTVLLILLFVSPINFLCWFID
jgi:hypothetical protein